jgi:hypothetical protein
LIDSDSLLSNRSDDPLLKSFIRSVNQIRLAWRTNAGPEENPYERAPN